MSDSYDWNRNESNHHEPTFPLYERIPFFLHLLQDEIYLQCRTAGGLLVTMTSSGAEVKEVRRSGSFHLVCQKPLYGGFSPNHVIPKKVIISFTAFTVSHTLKKHTKNTGKLQEFPRFFFSPTVETSLSWGFFGVFSGVAGSIGVPAAFWMWKVLRWQPGDRAPKKVFLFLPQKKSGGFFFFFVGCFDGYEHILDILWVYIIYCIYINIFYVVTWY